VGNEQYYAQAEAKNFNFVRRLERNNAMVPRVGIEPTLPKEQDFKSCVYTNFTIAA
jgi:hypothetical protein